MAKQRWVKTGFRSDEYVEGLNPETKLLFLYLLTNEASNLVGIYTLTLKRMCFETGLSKEQILDSLEILENDQKILYLDNRVVFKSYIHHQMQTESIIRGIVREFELVPANIVSAITDHPRLGGIGPLVGLLKLKLKPILKLTSNNIPDGIESFNKFWSVYPRKESKGNAEKAFAKAYGLVDMAALIAGVEGYCVHIRKNKIEKQFIKHPATWLNQKCWSDDYKSTAVAPTPTPVVLPAPEENMVQSEATKLAIKNRLAEVKSDFIAKSAITGSKHTGLLSV